MADIEIRQESPTAFYIKVHETDNVAIIVNDNGLKAGARFPDGLELIEHIPQLWRSDRLCRSRHPTRQLD